jgi:DNA-binding transcriptional LysR family regulator
MEESVDRLDELAVLVAILDAGSLAAAGRRLRRSPPAMSRALAALEERVGARLIERTTRRLAPTEAGLRLEGHARRVLSGYDEVVREGSRDAMRGELRITAPLVFGRRHVMPIVASFLDAHPGLRIELVLNDRSLDLIDQKLDVAVRIGHLADSSLVARRVGEVRRLLVASPVYLSRQGVPRAPEDLAAHQVVLVSGPPEWRFRKGARSLTVRVAPRLLVNEIDAMLLAVRAGHGIGRPLSYQVADDLAVHSLVRLLPEFEPEPLPVQLVVPSARNLAPKVRAFLDHAARALSALGVIRAWS